MYIVYPQEVEAQIPIPYVWATQGFSCKENSMERGSTVTLQ